VIDGTGGQPRRADVVVDDTRIAELRPVSAGGQSIDLDGMWLLPGLIDAHSHFGLVSFTEGFTPAAVTAGRIFRNCQLALEAGFTTVRDTGGIDGGVATAVDQGLVLGPRIFPSGPILCQTGGHGDATDPFALHSHDHLPGIAGLSQTSLPCDGPDEVRVAARTAFRRGATQLKVCVSGGVLSFTDRLEDAQFTAEELAAAVAEAEARDTYVTAHAHSVRGIRNGLAAGVACFEHGTFLDEQTVAAMAAAGACLVPTFSVTRIIADQYEAWGVPAELLPRMAGVENSMAHALQLARAAGLVIGSGSDILGPHQTRRGLELAIRAELEDPMQAIVSATAANARILRRHDKLGTIEPGKLADLIALDFDPLHKPQLFEDPDHVRLVVKGGRVVKDTR